MESSDRRTVAVWNPKPESEPCVFWQPKEIIAELVLPDREHILQLTVRGPSVPGENVIDVGDFALRWLKPP